MLGLWHGLGTSLQRMHSNAVVADFHLHCCRLIIVSNVLPIRAKRQEPAGWQFEWDQDALVAQAKVRTAAAAAAAQLVLARWSVGTPSRCLLAVCGTVVAHE